MPSLLCSSDAWLTLSETSFFKQSTYRDRVRAAVAGWITTATFNAILVVLLGYQEVPAV